YTTAKSRTGLPAVAWMRSGDPPSPWLRRACSSLRLALRTKRRLERVTRLELATSSLARRCSTTELHPHFTYEKRPHKKAEKYACPAILSGIPSGSNENTRERCIPESSRMFVPLFIERRLLCALRERWQGSPPFPANDGSRIGTTRARLVKRRAEASRSRARQADAR